MFVADLVKKISFRRLKARNVTGYEIYAKYRDDTYASGIRTELLDVIPNPSEPSTVLKTITLESNENYTWKLPEDAYLDRDHQFRLFCNGFILNTMYYSFNRLTKLITLDTVMKTYSISDVITMQYYQDIITKEYMLTEDCQIQVKPVFSESYSYGNHNVII